MGPESEQIMKTFSLSTEDAKDYKTVVEEFRNYFSPRKNVLRFCRAFYQSTQQLHEDTPKSAFGLCIWHLNTVILRIERRAFVVSLLRESSMRI